MTSSANFNRQSYVPYHSLSIATCTCSQYSIAFFNTILPHRLSNANSHRYARNVPAMSAGKELGGYCMKACDAIMSKCLWWLAMNGEAHNFVYWNWLMMSSRAKRIGRRVMCLHRSSVLFAKLRLMHKTLEIQMHVDFCWSVVMYTPHIAWLWDINVCHIFYNIFFNNFCKMCYAPPPKKPSKLCDIICQSSVS